MVKKLYMIMKHHYICSWFT